MQEDVEQEGNIQHSQTYKTRTCAKKCTSIQKFELSLIELSKDFLNCPCIGAHSHFSATICAGLFSSSLKNNLFREAYPSSTLKLYFGHLHQILPCSYSFLCNLPLHLDCELDEQDPPIPFVLKCIINVLSPFTL